MSIKEITKPILVAATSAFLSGCYVTDVAVISKGEQAPIAAKFSCKSSFGGDPELHEFEEFKGGSFFSKTYEYKDSTSPNEVIMFEKLDDDLYLSQVRKTASDAALRNYRFEYVYFHLVSEDQVTIMVPNLMEHGPILEAKAASFSVGLESLAYEVVTFVKVRGSVQSIGAFLSDHSLANLTVISTCSRV